MNSAFSTIRVASSITLMPSGSQSARMALTLAIETGWPPAMLTVPASETYGILLRADLVDQGLELGEVDVALERQDRPAGRGPRR